MRNILPDNQMRALAMAMASAVVAAVAMMFVPVHLLEGLTGSIGISEIFGAAKPPLGDTARALMAFGTGALTLAVLAFILLRQEQSAAADGGDTSDDADRPRLRGLLSKIETPKMPWTKDENDITELSDLPKLKNGDSHPDAPARRPLSAQDLSLVDQTEMPTAEPVTDNPAQPAETVVQNRPVIEPRLSAEHAPVIAPVPVDNFKPSLAEMVAQLEAAVAERKKQLADLEIVAAQLGASGAVAPNAEPSVAAVPAQRPLEAVPMDEAKTEHMDDALASALATLHRMNDGGR